MVIGMLAAADAARPLPQPPCGSPPVPAYPAIGTVTIEAWDASELPGGWSPPRCTGWQGAGARILVALSGSFPHGGGSDDLLARFAAVSAMRGIRYWSVTDKQWRPLIVDAAALTGTDRNSRRADFTLAELKSGQTLSFLEQDSRSGAVTYHLRLLESGPDRFVLAIDNATPIKFMLFTLFPPGAMQSVYFIERLAPDRWGYYSLLRAGADASSMVAGHAGSSMNRAQALYRHFLGAPTDQEPPASP
jgi:hypothetical protein